MKDKLSMGKNMDLEYIIILMEIFTKDFGNMIKNKDKDKWNIEMVISIMGILSTAENKERALIIISMAIAMKEILLKT